MKKQKDERESGTRSLSGSRELAEDIFRDALGELKGKGPESGKEPEGSPWPPDVKTQETTDEKSSPGPRKDAPAPSGEAKEKAPLKASDAGTFHAGDKKGGPSKANAGAVETDKGPVETFDRPSGKRGILLICLVAGIVAVAAGAGIYIYGNVNLGEKGSPEVNIAPKEIVKDSGASKGAMVRREIERPPSGETAVSGVPEDRKIQDVAQVEPDRPVPDREQAAIAPSFKEEKQGLREGSGARDSAAGQKVEELTVKTSEKSKPGPAPKKVEPVSDRAVVS